MTFKQRCEIGKSDNLCWFLKEGCPGRVSSQCKGLEVGECLIRTMKDKEARRGGQGVGE